MKCEFCQQETILDSSYDEWKCLTCHVAILSYEGESKHIRFSSHFNNNDYYLNLFTDSQQTLLVIKKSDSGDFDFSEIKVEYYLDGVTPDNVIEKIKLLLVFS
jgi:hypothetical protein